MNEPASPVRSRVHIGDVVDGRYELRRDLGIGSTGRVFEAVHRFTGRSVALKLVAPDTSAHARPELEARLAREARALAAVRHPGIVQVLDGGVMPDGTPYLVLELLEGRTLEGLLASRGRLSVKDTIALALQLSAALDATHAAGVIHRDVKPSNVLVVKDHARREVIKLIDFGIVRVETSEEHLTRIGALIGTPAYMAPEQLLGLENVDHRSDVYALGVMMFECLTGRLPYEGTYQQVLLKVCSSDAVPAIEATGSTVPAPIAAIVLKAMQKEPSARYDSMKELGQALRDAIPDTREQTEIFGPPPRLASAPPPAEDQRRKLPRAPYVTPLRIEIEGITIDGRSEDISTGGVLVVCHQVCPIDKRATMRFALPIEGHVVTVGVHVRWVKAARADDPLGPRALGVEFIDPPVDMTRSIARYVHLMMNPQSMR